MSVYTPANREDSLYFEMETKKTNILFELMTNAHRTINSVSIFKYFDEYCEELISASQTKKPIYWTVAYYETLIDQIKIVLAFETYCKVMLVKKGILINKVGSHFDKNLRKMQQQGIPIHINDFYQNNSTYIDFEQRKISVNGLNNPRVTITFSQILNEYYQEFLMLDNSLLHYLKKINSNRNRLHLYYDFNGAHKIETYIKEWKFIKEQSFSLIKKELDQIELDRKIQIDKYQLKLNN